MLQCWPAQLSQHSSYATLPSIIRQHPPSNPSLHHFKSLYMYIHMHLCLPKIKYTESGFDH